MGIGRRATAIVATITALGLTWAVPAAAAYAPACQSPSDPGQVIAATPWQQQWLAPERVWPFSTGAGVRVAVVDSGSDAQHPQLSGRVLRGVDMLGGVGGNVDCVSHGTAVASVIVAQRQQGVGFIGLAPGAQILPIRVSERVIADGEATGDAVSPKTLADAIVRAVDLKASVVNLSLALYEPNDDVEAAVRYAVDRGVVVVAAAGNLHKDGRTDPVTYPAAYPGVIGVGAIDQTGARVSESQVGPYVDIVAPGGAVVAATRVRGHATWNGTSLATPMVSATVALIRAAEPELTVEQVTARLLATADPARGGVAQGYGHGVVNPYRAVTERLTDAAARRPQGLPAVSVDPAVVARADRWSQIGAIAVWAALGLAVLTVLVAAVAFLSPYGRERRWRPARTEPAPEPQPAVEDPEEAFFKVPAAPTG